MKFQYILAVALVCGFAAGQGERDDLVGVIDKCLFETVTALSTQVHTCVDGDDGLKDIVKQTDAIAEATGFALGDAITAVDACNSKEGHGHFQCYIDAFQGLQTDMQDVVTRVQKLGQTIQDTEVKSESKECLETAVEGAQTGMEFCLGQ